ncbi:TatD family hydrolase [Butyrivibrio sp. INlla16]|uniref:TatD family hydrolase n=1 Tax=Butyrivibrio sp. INlla16 TaxID=1520807 RepID=UPI00087E1842|nr:TatD family hydrolase [Butyrivibrio sp. INlla16]SDB54894.1 TatD DNase family protein [Butyrivibrio sp. INlla16]
MIFETHAHYDDEAFDSDRDSLLSSMTENGIGTIVNATASKRTVEKSIELTKKYPFIYTTIGVHPSDCDEMDEEELSWLESLCSYEKAVAVGEIGLDYHYDEPSRDIQKKWFEAQLDMARSVKLPVIIHSRDAAKDTLDIMKSMKAEEIGGDIHCFSYPVEIAKEYLGMGFYIGVGGVITFKNGKKLREVVEYAPIEQIVIETDSPYLAPEPYRGKRNSSLNLPFVADKIAEIKGLPVDKVIEITELNAKKLYNL